MMPMFPYAANFLIDMMNCAIYEEIFFYIWDQKPSLPTFGTIHLEDDLIMRS